MASHSLPPIALEPIDTSRFEKVDGKLIERPVPTLQHGKLQRRITDHLLEHAIAGRSLAAIQEVSVDRWDEAKSDWLTPDAMVSRDGGFVLAKNGHVLPPILLAVEVLSAGQSFANMRQKAVSLLSWGCQQVWLLDGETSSIAVFQAATPMKYEVIYEGRVAAGWRGGTAAGGYLSLLTG